MINVRYYGTSQYKRIMKYVGEDQSLWHRRKNLCQIVDFACPYDGRVDTKELEKNRILSRFGTRVEKDMEHESQGYTSSDRCHMNNTHKVKTLVKGNRYWNSGNRFAENCPPAHCSNPPKGSWGLRKLVVTGPQEHKSTVKIVCYIIRQ